MICPFNHIHSEQVNQNVYEYDVDGRNTFHEHVFVEDRAFAECEKENCGVWRDGKCWYNGAER